MAIKAEHLITRNNKQYVLYAGLLSEAHEQGLSSILTEILQFPTEANGQTAVCRATVTTSKGTFTGIGDANAGNVPKHILPHIIRMAETRSKCRALRDATNIAMCAVEELAGFEPDDAPKPAAVQPTPFANRLRDGSEIVSATRAPRPVTLPTTESRASERRV